MAEEEKKAAPEGAAEKEGAKPPKKEAPKKEAAAPAAEAKEGAKPEAGKRKLPKGRHLSAIKRQRQSVKRRARNQTVSSGLKTAVRRVREAVAKKDAALIQKNFREAVSLFHKAASKGIVHPRNASRHVARLSSLALAKPDARSSQGKIPLSP